MECRGQAPRDDVREDHGNRGQRGRNNHPLHFRVRLSAEPWQPQCKRVGRQADARRNPHAGQTRHRAGNSHPLQSAAGFGRVSHGEGPPEPPFGQKNQRQSVCSGRCLFGRHSSRSHCTRAQRAQVIAHGSHHFIPRHLHFKQRARLPQTCIAKPQKRSDQCRF